MGRYWVPSFLSIRIHHLTPEIKQLIGGNGEDGSSIKQCVRSCPPTLRRRLLLIILVGQLVAVWRTLLFFATDDKETACIFSYHSIGDIWAPFRLPREPRPGVVRNSFDYDSHVQSQGASRFEMSRRPGGIFHLIVLKSDVGRIFPSPYCASFFF